MLVLGCWMGVFQLVLFALDLAFVELLYFGFWGRFGRFVIALWAYGFLFGFLSFGCCALLWGYCLLSLFAVLVIVCCFFGGWVMSVVGLWGADVLLDCCGHV